jgi:hypothetical protein
MTTRRTHLALALTGLTALAACGSVPKRTFHIRAIDTDEKPLTCLVIVEDDWQVAAEKHRVAGSKGPLALDLVFDRPTIEITVMQVAVDDSGKMLSPPTSRSSDSEYRTEVRTIGQNDPPDQLFILERR